MRTLPAGLQAHLDTGATTLCHCWKLSLASGEILGFTDHDDDIAFDDVTFEAASGFTATEMEESAGFAPANLDVAGGLRSNRLSAERLAAGDFDDAAAELWTVNWCDPAQRLLLRKGRLGGISHGDTGFTAEFRGRLDELDQPRGRIFAHSCDATLGDQRCKAPVTVQVGAVAAVEDRRRLTVSGLGAMPGGWLTGGMLTIVSGANAGRSMEIKFHSNASGTTAFELWHPLPYDLTAGDAVQVTPGCDKQFETCKTKFANAINFRGFPHMPGNDFVGSYPNRGDANDGQAI